MKPTHPISEVIELFSEYIDVTKITNDAYVQVLKRYEAYLIKHKIKIPRRKTIMNYRDSLWKAGKSNTTVEKYMSVIKQFYRWARKHQAQFDLDPSYKFDIAEGLKGAKVELYYKKEPLSIKQVHTLLKTVNDLKTDIIGYRNYAIILLMLVTGLRSVEVRRAKQDDFSYIENKTILYVQGKGSQEKTEFVRLPREVINAITEYLYLRVDDNPYLFVSHGNQTTQLKKDYTSKLVKHYLKESGIDSKRITAHSLRHTSAYLNLKHGGTLASTRQLLRHKDIASTMIYTDHLDRLKNDSEERLETLYFKKEKIK